MRDKSTKWLGPCALTLALLCLGFPGSGQNNFGSNAKFASATSFASAQSPSKVTVQDVLLEVRRVYGIQLSYKSDVVQNLQSKANVSFNKEESVESILLKVLKPNGLTFKRVKDVYIIVKEDNQNPFQSHNLQAIDFLLAREASIQEQVVTGKVLDEKGVGMPGVTVVLKGTSKGTATNSDGFYSLSVPDATGTLVISFIGYQLQEVPINKRASININLVPNSTALDEVVVIGYGEVKKRDLTGSVASVKGEELTKFPVTTVVEALQGKVPGADITRSNGYAGQGPSIRIRGNRSIGNPGSSNRPLYIVDGVQGVDVSVINPNDIESIDVLKDASSTAIYGSRGANGVIIITTKRGVSDKPKFTFNSYAGVSEVAGYGKYMTGPEYVAFRREAYRAAGNWNSPEDDSKIFNAPLLAAIENQEYTSWPELLINNGYQQDYQLGISGGSEKTKVYFSGNYFNEKGILKNDEFKRYTGRLNVDQTINNWLKVGIQTQLAYTDNDRRRDPFNVASKVAPLGSPYNEDGSLNFLPGHGNEVNPLADEQPGAWKRNVQGITGSMSSYLEIRPIKDLSFRSSFAATLSDSDQGHFNSKYTIDGKGANSRSEITTSKNRFISWENVLNYTKDIKDHTISVTGIASNISSMSISSYAGGNNQLLESQEYFNLTGAAQNMYLGSNYTQHNLISFAGRLNYSWKGKYLLTLTGRSDGSSKLGPGNKWAFFPSAAVGWRISDESFMRGQELVNDLKLRASYGVSGNDVINPYATQNSLTQIQFSYDDANPAMAYGLNPTIGNPNLRWELTTTANFGLDFGILTNRITGSIDYYDALTSDLIFPLSLPLSTGVATVNQNIGKTRNKGVELAITTHNITTKNFSWSSNFTFFKNKEEIVELPNGNVIDNDYRRSLIKGQPAQIYFDYKKIGIWQLGEEAEAAQFGAKPGEIKIADLSGPDGVPDGKITADDKTIIGTTVPKWSGGLNNNFKFKGFDLNVYLFARVGQWASSDYYGKYRRNGQNNNPRVDYWTPENPTNAFPSPHATAAYNFITTTTLYESSYVKLRNATLGYTIPNAITSKFKLENVRIYISGRNLFAISDFKDFDPESEGITDQPLNRLYVGGLNLTF
ncbi:SusC/RagA family TonB-linked outer membrane protein [Pontibacter sp. 13R65]|uniref:SusC/RagA family TonB-linked outer membrane protein n=1 Tax=Pontibacter sp. 13R65 TaxID=3127458 RepID=UPI00301D78A2